MSSDAKSTLSKHESEDFEPSIDSLDSLDNILKSQLEDLQHLENMLPVEYIKHDPNCIRKYSNFSFPKDYKKFYDFIDYFPSKDVISEENLDTSKKIQKYLQQIHDKDMYNDFINTLTIVSPKTITLLNKIKELDEKDMAKHGKKFKHFIFSDSKYPMGGVKLLASALMAFGFKSGYSAKPRTDKKKWDKIELFSNAELAKSKYNNFYMLSSNSVYEQPINTATKKEILSRFNERPDNSYGENVRIILMDGGYKEGIDLFDIKYVHIFEPTLTQADQKQVIGRGTRTCGQKGLDFHPQKGWPLYVYVYDLKMEDPFDKALDANTGIEMYFKAKNLNIKLLNFANELEAVCIQNAVDYELNKNIHSFKILSDKEDSVESNNSNFKTISSHSNSILLNEHFYEKELSKINSPIEYSIDKPLDAVKMRKYIRDYFSQYAWKNLKMENNCITKGGKQFGGSTIMTYTPTQDFVSHFFTPNNPLKGMLLWHSVGTGKTCTAIATATTTFEKEGYTILWVTRTTLKNDIWKNIFDQVCHQIIKLKIENNGIVIPSNNKNRMKLLSKSWKVRPMSYKQFSNLVSKKNKIYETMVKINGKEDPLRKTLLIIDEAHKLYGGGDLSSIETPDMASFHESVMNSYIVSGADSVKLLLMTATPIQTDPMELIKLINLFKMPDQQMSNNFDVFSHEYLNGEGFFKPEGLDKFRNEIAGHISYLNREKDARQFAQPIVHSIETNVYDKELLKYNKKATRKLYNKLNKEVKNKLSTLKKNPIFKTKLLDGYIKLKNVCNTYEFPKARTACKKIVSTYKKNSTQQLKENKEKIKQELNNYKIIAKDFKELRKTQINNAKMNELNSPLLFHLGDDEVELKNLASVYGRLTNCPKSIKNDKELIEGAISQDPNIANLKAEVEKYKQRIDEKTLTIKKYKNASIKKTLKKSIHSDKKHLKDNNRTLKTHIREFIKKVKNTINKTKKNIKNTKEKQKKMISKLKKTKKYTPEFEDKELEVIIKNDIKNAVEKMELEMREKKQARTMKKMAIEQKKLQKQDAKLAKQHAITMKKAAKEKAKEDKEFAKLQKAREAELNKIAAAAKKEHQAMEKQRKKEEKQRQKEDEAQAKKQAAELKKIAAAAKKEEQAMEKQRKKEAKTKKNIKGGNSKTRKRI